MALFRCPYCNNLFKIKNAYKYDNKAKFNCSKCNENIYMIGKKNQKKTISLNHHAMQEQHINKFDLAFDKRFNESIKETGEISKYNKTKAVVGGATAGAVTAAGTTAAVAAFGSASTGTAIASLSGAAATKATLAWLGGGALVAGGGGVAMGVIVLTAGAGTVGLAGYKKLLKKKT